MFDQQTETQKQPENQIDEMLQLLEQMLKERAQLKGIPPRMPVVRKPRYQPRNFALQ